MTMNTFCYSRFPSDELTRSKWIYICGKGSSVRGLVCSRHFTADDYSHCGKRVRLKKNAVPHKNIPSNGTQFSSVSMVNSLYHHKATTIMVKDYYFNSIVISDRGDRYQLQARYSFSRN